MNSKLKTLLSVGVGIVTGVGFGLAIPEILNKKKESDCKNLIRSMMFWIKEEANDYLSKGDAISAQAVWDTYVGTVREHNVPLMNAGLDDVIEDADYIFNMDTECDYIFEALTSLKGTIAGLSKIKNCNKEHCNKYIKAYNMIHSMYASMLKEADYKRWKSFEPIELLK